MKNKFFSTTVGRDVQVFVSPKDLASYADGATTLETLVGKTAGTIAILNEDNTVRTTALTAGTKFRVAQVNKEKIKLSPLFTFGSGQVTKKAYEAPVKHVIKVAGIKGAVAKNANVMFSCIDTTPGVEPMPRYHFETTLLTAGFAADALILLARKVNNALSPENDANKQLCIMELTADAGAAVTATVTATNGSDSVTFSADPTADGVAAAVWVTIGGSLYKIKEEVSATVFTLDRPYQGATGAGKAVTVVTNNASLEVDFTLTAVDFGSHFTTTLLEGLDGVVTVETPFKQGSGTPEEIAYLEQEGNVRDGVGTFNVAFKEDYGQPASYVSSTGQYTQYNVTVKNTERAIAGGYPENEAVSFNNVVIAVDAGDATITSLNTIFGV